MIKQNLGCISSMVIWPEFHMGQYRDEDHREEALNFNSMNLKILPLPIGTHITYVKIELSAI